MNESKQEEPNQSECEPIRRASCKSAGRPNQSKTNSGEREPVREAKLSESDADDPKLNTIVSNARMLIFRPRAAFDLESIVVYLGEALGMPKAAKQLYDQIMDAAQLLCEQPTLGRRFFSNKLERSCYRWFLVEQYRLFYTFDDANLTVWRIVHTSQNIDDYALIEW